MAADLIEEILTCERRVWDALVAGNAQADSDALDGAFLGVYPDGFAGKSAHVGQLSDGPTVRRYEITDARMMRLGADHVLLAYKADYTRISANKPEEMLVSSIWRRSGGGWTNVFSQDTPMTGHPVP